MTEDELNRMEWMWAQGMPIRLIARQMGYSALYVTDVVRAFRYRFPKRRDDLTDEEWAPWIERIRSGELTPKDVREALDVCKETVRKRMRAAGIEPRRRYGQKGNC
jgi:hypothetical protein